jgi:GT2 family glycosyltransferase
MLEDIAIMGEVFDADFFIHKEDIDICWRAQLYNWTALYVPEAVAHHIRAFRPGQRHQVDMEVRFYAVRNRYLLMLKHETWTTFLRDAWAILSYDVAILVYLLLFERPSLGALRAAWVLRRRMREKHRVIQAQGRANRRLVLRWLEAR